MEEQNHEKKPISDNCPGLDHGRRNAYRMRRQNRSCGIVGADFRRTDHPPEESSSVEPSSTTELSAEPLSEESSAESEEQAPAEEVTLNIFYYTFTDSYEETGIRPSNAADSMIESFENAHPDIKIEMDIRDGSLMTLDDRLVAELIMDPADVVLFEEPLMPECTRSLQDLTPYIENGDIDISAYGDIIENIKLYTKTDTPSQYFLPTPGGDSVAMAPAEWGLGHEEAALEFIKFICGEEGAAVYEENGIPLYEENKYIIWINEFVEGLKTNTGAENTNN